MKTGFTLIEITLVLAIMAVTAVVIFEKAYSPQSAALDAAARQVKSHIELARDNAITKRQTSGVSFVSGSTYTAYETSISTPLKNPLTKQNLIVTLGDNFSSVSLTSSYTVEFNKEGKPTVGGGGSITIANGSSSKTISVTANTGKVSIQ